jgi:hypothetical protein
MKLKKQKHKNLLIFFFKFFIKFENLIKSKQK